VHPARPVAGDFDQELLCMPWHLLDRLIMPCAIALRCTVFVNLVQET
jgi:hypothetical protein